MFNKSKLSKVALAVALSGGISASAIAQETSSSIRGTIVGPQGNAAANTTLVIIHEPTGSRKTVTTNDAGAFIAKGLRVGGPYKVTIDSPVFRDAEVQNVYLSLGNTFRLDQQLQDEQIESIVVTGSPVLFNSSANNSYFGSEQIASTPSITRDIKDIVRNNPLVIIQPGEDAGMTIAGSNPRMNSISIDGIPLNDDFGLNNNGYPTQRNPFPLDALDQVSVDVAPSNAKSGGFTGGNVDAVFKSGTNEFHGKVFYEKGDTIGTAHNNRPILGGLPTDTRENDGKTKPTYDEKNYGVSLGGPIIEDKLFFFAAYEKFESPQPLDYGAAGSGIGANETTATVAEFEKVREIAKRVYGVDDIGSFRSQPQLDDEKYMFKLDWNINEDHRADLVYLFNEGNRTRNMTNNNRELKLDTHWYNKADKLNNFSAKLYSDWTDQFSSEISITRKKVETTQASLKNNLGLGDVTIRNLPSGGSIAFGSDAFRHSNSLDNELTIFKFDGSYLFDEHSLEFGIDYRTLDINNQFLPNSRGSVVFRGIDDFENRKINSYIYSNGKGNNPQAVAAAFKRQDLALYVNDTWDMTDDLTLSFGLRYERLASDDKPLFNQGVKDRTGFDNTFNMDGVDIILPRFGFTYLFNDDVTIRGSVGRYAGGNPNVWISNSYSNDGQSMQTFSVRSGTAPSNILTTPPPAAIAAVNAGTRGSVANFIDPNFDIPSQWTYMLNTDVTVDIPYLGEDLAWTSTAIYTDKENSAEWVNASLLNGRHRAGQTKDGALPFYNTRELEIMLTNAEEDGRSVILSTGLSKTYDNGFKFDASYTYQDVTEGNPGGSSTARSNYRFGHFSDHQKTQVGPSNYMNKHRFVLNLGYKKEFFEGYDTRFNLFIERRSGSPYSHLVRLQNLQGGRFFNQDLIQPAGFNSTFGGNYLPYIPTANDPNVRYEGITEAQVLHYFNGLGLGGYAGGLAPRGKGKAPWTTTMDLYVSQEIPGLMDGHKGEVFFVVNNLLNLIDSSAGKVYRQEFGTRQVIQMDIDKDTGQYIYGPIENDELTFEAVQSTYRIKLGVRYSF